MKRIAICIVILFIAKGEVNLLDHVHAHEPSRPRVNRKASDDALRIEKAAVQNLGGSVHAYHPDGRVKKLYASAHRCALDVPHSAHTSTACGFVRHRS
jgi:hypothetical protein